MERESQVHKGKSQVNSRAPCTFLYVEKKILAISIEL